MSKEVKLCAIRKCWSDSKISRRRPRRIGSVSTICSQICRRDLEEVCFELLFAILFPSNEALLGNNSPIIVGGIAAGVAKITPISAPVRLK